nr:MAG TPA: hypothetical protein [Caudoviricetes sp.]
MLYLKAKLHILYIICFSISNITFKISIYSYHSARCSVYKYVYINCLYIIILSTELLMNF